MTYSIAIIAALSLSLLTFNWFKENVFVNKDTLDSEELMWAYFRLKTRHKYKKINI